MEQQPHKASKSEAAILLHLLDTYDVICLDCQYCKKTFSNNSRICRDCLEAECRARKIQLKDSIIDTVRSIITDFNDKTGK